MATETRLETMVAKQRLPPVPPSSPSAERSAADETASELQAFFLPVFMDDAVDLRLFRGLSAVARPLAEAVLLRRFDAGLLRRLAEAGPEEQRMEAFGYLRPKRMDHCEKTVMSLLLTLLRDKFKAERYGRARPKELHDEVSRAMFREFFPPWADPDQLVSISKDTDSKEESERLPRWAAVFCMKRGLTKHWFRAVSSRLLDALLAVDPQQAGELCRARYQLKLAEVFQSQDAEQDYAAAMRARIGSTKFKLPVSTRELAACLAKTKKKAGKLRQLTLQQEKEEACAKMGEAEGDVALAAWRAQCELSSGF